MAVVGTYVIVRDGKSTFLHNNIGGYETLECSVAGPELTLRFLDTYHRLGFGGEDTGWEPEWFTYGVCEGGLLVDCDQRVLIVFTEHRGWAARAAYLDTVRRTWPGWQVRWAYDGIADLTRHVGLDTVGVKQAGRGPSLLYPHGRDQMAELVYLVTVAGEGGRTTVHALTWDAAVPWRVGAGLLDALREGHDTPPAFHDVPRAGMHLDPATRTVGVWTANRPLTGLVEDWPELWPGWRLEFWEDRFHLQLQRCGDAVTGVTVPGPEQRALELAYGVVGTWLFFLAEDVDRNYRTIAKDSPWQAGKGRQETWNLTREQTAMTRSDMATLLQAITGRRYRHPRWPKTMDEISDALR